MKISSIKIIGIKSHENTEFHPEKYTSIVGENNSGKSNILVSLLWFFGKTKLSKTDIHLGFSGMPSVVVDFELEEGDKAFVEKSLVTNNHILIEGYCERGDLEKAFLPKYRFPAESKLKQSKLPFDFDVVFIPSIRELSEEMKFTANSSITALIRKFVVSRIKNEDSKSEKYSSVCKAISELSNHISNGETSAFGELEKTIKDKMLEYSNTTVKFKLEPFNVDDLIKSSVRYFVDVNKSELPVESQGMGFQRALTFSLISSVSAINSEPGFFTLYLIEEPELFLHPNQQTSFRNMLIDISKKDNNQVMITSHSPYFVNNISNYSEVKRVSINKNKSIVTEVNHSEISKICSANGQLMAEAMNETQNPKWDLARIQQEASKITAEDELRYLLWVDPERANAFLSKKVILVEGKTEKAFFSFAFNNPNGEFYKDKRVKDVSIVDVNGKYHFYKFANLLNKLGISCWIVYDGDGDKNNNGISHKKLNSYIENLKTDRTIIDSMRIDPELETCLGFKKDEHKPDVSMYHNLSSNIETCKANPKYNAILAFVNKILSYEGVM